MKRLSLMLAATAALLPAGNAMAALAVGAQAPDFTTRGARAGKTFTLTRSHQLKRG
ncbi:MAG: peroxiredoxin, partial [Pseudomonadota bacterium]|nr:peroxiredoxin [Pseudomonadota bacterium]